MNEATIEALAPSPDVFAAGVLLFLNGAITVQLRTDDATLIFGACAGSGALPYEVSADLRAAVPVLRCSCPSRKRLCKHALALLVAHARQHAVFVVAEVPRDLVEKLAKDDAKAAATQPASRAKKRKAPNKEAQAKKAQAQLEGLEMASRVLNDLAMSGLGAVDEDRIAALRSRHGDRRLPSARRGALPSSPRARGRGCTGRSRREGSDRSAAPRPALGDDQEGSRAPRVEARGRRRDRERGRRAGRRAARQGLAARGAP